MGHFDDTDPVHGTCRAFAVKVEGKRLPVFPFSGFDLYHQFRNDAFYGLYNLLKVQKTGKREVVLGQPLPQTLYGKIQGPYGRQKRPTHYSYRHTYTTREGLIQVNHDCLQNLTSAEELTRSCILLTNTPFGTVLRDGTFFSARVVFWASVAEESAARSTWFGVEDLGCRVQGLGSKGAGLGDTGVPRSQETPPS